MAKLPCFDLIEVDPSTHRFSMNVCAVPADRFVARILGGIHQPCNFFAKDIIDDQGDMATYWKIVLKSCRGIERIGKVLMEKKLTIIIF